jgi:hypothetical protein
MSTIHRALLSAVLLSAACSEGPTAPADPMFKFDAGTAVTRPVAGSCDAVVSNFAFAFPIITFDLGGTCRIQHLGQSVLAASETVLLLAPDFSTGSITRTGSYTAANGDVLSFTFTGTATLSATGVTFSGTETYLGGTGRFASVSGSSAQQGTTDGISAGQYTISGLITY